jgi:hypothetical protein
LRGPALWERCKSITSPLRRQFESLTGNRGFSSLSALHERRWFRSQSLLHKGLISTRCLESSQKARRVIAKNVGHFLQETAEWCNAKGWLPINSLAVNADTRRPGRRLRQRSELQSAQMARSSAGVHRFPELPNNGIVSATDEGDRRVDHRSSGAFGEAGFKLLAE